MPFTDTLAHRLHNARQFMAGDMRQYNVRIVSLPAVPVAQANASRHHFNDYATGRRHRVRHLLDFERA